MGALPKRLQGNTPSHARSRVQEKETAQRVGGNVTRRSGAGLVKGDVCVKNIARIENKTTKNKSFSVTTDLIDKLENAVAGSNEIPFFQIELNGGTHKFVVLPNSYLEDLIEYIRVIKELQSAAKQSSE